MKNYRTFIIKRFFLVVFSANIQLLPVKDKTWLI